MASESIILYDLGNPAGRPVSPYGWRVRESLHLLGIPFEVRLLGFGEIRRHLPGQHTTVPVIIDGGETVGDSWEIARFLSARRDPGGLLFGGANGFPLAEFVTCWVDATLMARVNRMIIKDVHDDMAKDDRLEFRTGREKRFGTTLEQMQSSRESERPAFQTLLHPSRRLIKRSPFLGGERPTYADFALHSMFVWARAVSRFELLRADDGLHGWIERMDEWLGPALNPGLEEVRRRCSA
ncbi:MAG: glutathione S-transferase N-terminal domain-containing protein [Arenicellales bacterium]